MGEFVIFGLAIAGFALASMILPWVNMTRIRSLESELARLKKSGIAATDQEPTLEDIGVDLTEKSTPWKEVGQVIAQPDQAVHTPKAKASDSSWTDDLAHHLSTKFPVWIGGIALALAGFFMVKYSIEHKLMSPTVRVILGGLFGIALLMAGHYGRSIKHLPNGERIAQSLTGAGIAVLYVVSFAASELYQLVPLWFGFAMMTVTTAVAVVLSVRHGVPIALLGMLGGFLTPAVMSTDSPSAATLFIYLYAIYTGLMIVIQRERWWVLSIPTLLGAFLWVILWLASGNMSPTDSVWVGLFLLAISMSMVMTTREEGDKATDTLLPEWNYRSVTNYMGLAGALALMGITAHQSGFQPVDWILYALLAAGSIALAYLQPRNYALIPLASLAVTSVMLMGWQPADHDVYAIVLIGFAALYVATGYWLMWRAAHPLLWALQMVFAAIGYYVLAYYRLADVWEVNSLPYMWGAIALVLAAAISYVLDMVRRSDAFDAKEQQNLLGVFLVAGTSLVSLALAIEIKGEFLSIAFAAEILAVSWIHSHLRLPFMKTVVALLLGVFAYLLLPQILLLVQLSAYSLVEAKLHLQQGVPIVDWPIFQLGVPAALLVGASIYLRKCEDSRIVQVLECSAIALLAVMGYYLMRHAFHVDEDVLFKKAGFVERGVTTNALFVMGLTCLLVGRRYTRNAVSLSGIVLAGTALFRILYFDLLAYNPLWSGEKVGDALLVNGMIFPYLLPIIWLYRASDELQHLGYGKVTIWLKACMLLFAFVWISFTVRHIFQGDNLSVDGLQAAENYAYSVVWLLFGLALVFVGAWKKDRAIHHASLGIILLVVGKAFLYDASELEGLYRVFSFLGLGVSLIGISYFFSRFVYLPDKKP